MEKKDKFIQKIQKLFGSRQVRILQHLYSRPPTTFRINTNLANVADVLKELKSKGFKIKPASLQNSYIVVKAPANKKLSETALFNSGKIYIQKLSSMVPALLLDPQEGERILDMCAAPGSKTSQISNLTKKNAQIIAVDNNKKRIYKLENNLNIQGIDNVEIINASGVGLERKYKSFENSFDRVLLDAPCSNEGLICLTDPHSLDHWNPKLPKKLSKLQKKLMASAVRLAKPGGTIVYSTCTFSKEENEDIVVWALDRFKNLSLLEVKKILPDGVFTGFFAAKFAKLE